ncbi:MAG: hypothetical protein FJ087_15620 [Deltaproteobacteria bacterium]|nr:hypothetical protein [Deltaproteobacteria bacterium]
MCDELVTCGAMNADKCAETMGILELSEGCVKAINDAPCLEHAKEHQSYEGTCFPPCTNTEDMCAGDLLSKCVNGLTFTYKCSSVCSLKGMKFTGTCGSSYKGQASSSGGDVCWCQ